MTDFLIRRFIPQSEQIQKPAVRKRYGMFAGIVGILCNLVLFGAKLVAGLLTASIAITADAFNNLSDAGSSIVTLAGFKLADKPADTMHPFGHGRMEYIAGLVVSLVILLVGFELLKSSIDKIITPSVVEYRLVSVLILVGSVCLKSWMYLFNRRIGQKIDSPAMRATAKDSLSDAVATTAVLAGVLIGHFSGLALDGYLGAVVALFILYAGVMTVRDTMNPLLGQMPDEEMVKKIEQTVLAFPEIIGMHDLIVHNYGPGRCMLSLHAEVPGSMEAMHAHDIIDMAEAMLKQEFSCDAVIHMDPVVTGDEEANRMQSLLTGIIHTIDPCLSLHDFRMTRGPLHTNLIFDLVVPYDSLLTDQQLKQRIGAAVANENPSYHTVICIDQAFTRQQNA